MHNGSHNNYHASSNYHHVSPRQAPQHRSSRFPENAPNRGNFVRSRDPVNNWSRVHDNQPRVLEEQTLFRRSERVQWGANARNRGGKFQRASQSPERPHQMGWDEAAESEVDEWGREIRERRQSPTYDERPSERIREEAPNHEIYAAYPEAKKRKRSGSPKNKPFVKQTHFERTWGQQVNKTSPKRPRIAERASWNGHQNHGFSQAPQHHQTSRSLSSTSMPNANPPLKGSYWRNRGGTNVPPESSKQNHEQTTLASPSQVTATRTPSTNYRAFTNQGIFDQKTRREIAPVGAQFRSALVNKFFENQDDEQESTMPVPPTKRFLPPTAPRSLINRIEPNFAGGQPTRQNSFLDAAPNKLPPDRERVSSPVSNSSSMPMEVSPQDLPSPPPRSKERHVQTEPNVILMQSSDIDSFATQAHTAPTTALSEALQKQVPKNDQTTEVDKREAYEFLGMVGAGSYGTVFKARDKTCGILVALKKIKTESQRDGFPVTALREIKILQSLHHENVVLLREMVVRKGSIFLNFEYVEHDLVGLLMQKVFELKPEHKKALTRDLLKGVDYIHSRGILHRDLKAANLLITRHGTLKLGDFGLARIYNKRKKADYTNRVCTLLYRSPELMLGETVYGPELDIWSAGCIFMELFLKVPPFQADHEIDQIRLIYSVLGSPSETHAQGLMHKPWYNFMKPITQFENCFRTKYRGALSEDGLDLAESLMHLDGNKRPSASSALTHPYFTNLPVASNPDLTSLHDDFHEYECMRKQDMYRQEQESQMK